MTRTQLRFLASMSAVALIVWTAPARAVVLDDFSSAGLELSNDPDDLHNVLTIHGFTEGVASSKIYVMAPPPTNELGPTQATMGPSPTGEPGSVLDWSQGKVKLSSVVTFSDDFRLGKLTKNGAQTILRLSLDWTYETDPIPPAKGTHFGDVKFTIEENGVPVAFNAVVPFNYNGDPNGQNVDIPLASFYPCCVFTNELASVGFEFSSAVAEGGLRFVSFGTIAEPGTMAMAACALAAGIGFHRRRAARRRVEQKVG